jgi:hypothetical protein
MNGAFGGNGGGSKTAAANTEITFLVPPDVRGYTRVTKAVYRSGSTAHTLTTMRPLGRTTAAAVAAISQAVVSLTAQPQSGNNVAANDYIAIRHSADGVTRLYKVSSVSSLDITMTANFTVAVAAGDKVWFFGAIGDTDPLTGYAHPTFLPPASATTTFEDREAGIVATHAKDDPIAVHSGNATAQSWLELTAWTYTQY